MLAVARDRETNTGRPHRYRKFASRCCRQRCSSTRTTRRRSEAGDRHRLARTIGKEKCPSIHARQHRWSDLNTHSRFPGCTRLQEYHKGNAGTATSCGNEAGAQNCKDYEQLLLHFWNLIQSEVSSHCKEKQMSSGGEKRGTFVSASENERVIP